MKKEKENKQNLSAKKAMGTGFCLKQIHVFHGFFLYSLSSTAAGGESCKQNDFFGC